MTHLIAKNIDDLLCPRRCHGGNEDIQIVLLIKQPLHKWRRRIHFSNGDRVDPNITG